MSRNWIKISGSSLAALEGEISAAIGKPGVPLTAYWKKPGFYRDGILISAHAGNRDHFLILTGGKDLTVLNGTTQVMLGVARRAKFLLSADTVIDYAYFFSYFCTDFYDRHDLISGVSENFTFQGNARRVIPLFVCRAQKEAGKIRLIGTIRSATTNRVYLMAFNVEDRGLVIGDSHLKYVGYMRYTAATELPAMLEISPSA